jgi:putative ABC transport system permease protein
MSDILAFAWQTITRHRLRSVLAILGVAIGVCALTSIMSVENSWRNTVTDFFSGMDLETVKVVMPTGRFHRDHLLPEDAEAIRAACPAVQAVTPMWAGIVQAEAQESSLEVGLRAVKADFTETLPDRIMEGRLFSAQEEAQRAPVCVISLGTRAWMFSPDEEVIGQPLRLDGRRFTIVGVIEGDRHIGISARTVYIPFTEQRSLVSTNSAFQPELEIYAHSNDPHTASRQIEKLLPQRLGGKTTQAFTASLWETRDAALRARSRVTLYSGLAGLCALLAAGIGIAALLFVSVAERSREIGIRRTLGATRSSIYCEYILAAALMAMLGGMLGGIIGIPASVIGAFASKWQPVMDSAGTLLLPESAKLPTISDIHMSVSWGALWVAIVLALLTGVVAALAPASEAAAIEPAQAIARRAGAEVRPRKLLTCLQVAFGVLVLILLTSYFSLLEAQERSEQRDALGQDRLSATADPIAALRKPFDMRYRDQCREVMAQVIASPERMAYLRRRTTQLISVTPAVPRWMVVSRGGRTLDPARVVFTTAEAFDYKPALPAQTKRQVSEAFRSGQAVTVITSYAQEKLFGQADPIGKTITIAGRKFTVLAVRDDPQAMYTGAGAAGPIGFYQTLKNLVSKQYLDMSMDTEAGIFARPLDTRQYLEAMTQLRDVLLPMLPAEFRKTIKFSEEIPETTRQFIFQHRAVAVRGAVGALAVLLVALIGLANMLLVSVHENMRETGLRRALGAQRSDVLLQFLAEGVLLSAIGAALGLALGTTICFIGRTQWGLPITVSSFWAIIGALATIIAGTAVSLPPALVAARVHPVEALHYE